MFADPFLTGLRDTRQQLIGTAWTFQVPIGARTVNDVRHQEHEQGTTDKD
jgi:hypothetical protein